MGISGRIGRGVAESQCFARLGDGVLGGGLLGNVGTGLCGELVGDGGGQPVAAFQDTANPMLCDVPGVGALDVGEIADLGMAFDEDAPDDVVGLAPRLLLGRKPTRRGLAFQ